MPKIYDMLVLGGGPGGYTAALYAARAGQSVLVIEKLSAGGQMATTEQVDNYPGFAEGIDGFELGERMQQTAERFGAETVLASASAVKLDGPIKEIVTDEGTFQGKTVVLATGASPRLLGLPGEQALRSHGMAYCAACDGMFFRGKTVAVIGGGNSAVGEALTLSKLAQKVYLIHRRDSLRADQVYTKPLEAADNIEIIWNKRPIELLHDTHITGLRLEDTQTGAQTELACDGVFAAIGRVPETALFQGVLELDAQGYIQADETTRTNLPGVFAVGDVRTKPLRQIITAAADGAVAAHFADHYLATQAP